MKLKVKQLMGNHLGKSSAVGQLTRPTQPFILLGSINESGERLRGEGRYGVFAV